MPRKELDLQIRNIQQDLLALSARVESAMLDSASALRDHNFPVSNRILQDDQIMNQKRFVLEGTIMEVIARQQPVTRDLRLLTAMLDMATELERMADYAKGLAIINLRSEGVSMPHLLLILMHMAEDSVDMLHRAMAAFIQQDVQSAIRIAGEDERIDALYSQIYCKAMEVAIVDPRNIERVNFVLWSAHNLERFADRVTNLCERTLFVATGELRELHRLDYEETPPVE
jgi:phosphate transport system protein